MKKYRLNKKKFTDFCLCVSTTIFGSAFFIYVIYAILIAPMEARF